MRVGQDVAAAIVRDQAGTGAGDRTNRTGTAPSQMVAFSSDIGGFGAAAVGTLVVSLVMTIVGTAAGFAAGWMVGSFLRFQRRGAAPWIGAGVGAVIQAGWASPVTVVQVGVLGNVPGALAGPAFLLTCMGLGYVIPRRIGLGKHGEP